MKLTSYTVKDKKFGVIDSDNFKSCVSDVYNFKFNKENGFMMRWGSKYQDDPDFSPIGPELLDLEISTGGCKNKCKFCYKNNTDGPPTNMSFDTFKLIVDKFPATLGQIAFGITGTQTNPDFIKMMEYCRKIGIIPNFTMSGIDLTQEFAEKAAKLVGALAVSAYQSDKNVCYNAIKMMTDLGLKQTNMHLMICQDNIDFVYEVLKDIKEDPRLEKLNAVVFLSLKPKGRAKNNFTPLAIEDFSKLMKHCMDNDIAFGFDSCGATKFETSVNNLDIEEKQKENLLSMCEPCESALFSFYVNVHGIGFPCSFMEGGSNWDKGIDIKNINDFIKDVWYANEFINWRKNLINNKRKCPEFII